MPAQQALTNSFSRVWFQDGGPGPARAVAYHGNWTAGALSWGRGDLTVIREPDPNAYGKFVRVGRFRGEPGDPELPIMARYGLQRSALLKAARGDCEHALHVAMGQCANPQDFQRGWTKQLIVEGAAINNYSTEALGAMGPEDTAPINEDVSFMGTDAYEIVRLGFASMAAALVTREITSVYVCDAEQCGACGIASDGCRVVFALEGGISASPGQAPTLLYTIDGGNNWFEIPITTITAAQQGNAIACIGAYTVVLSQDATSLHYALTSQVILGTPTWTAVSTGFVSTKEGIAMWSNGASDTWIVGEGGYIYHSTDPTAGVTVANAGAATTSDLNDVHFYDPLNGVVVGASNTVVYTNDGGATWASITGPAVGVVLNAVWMSSPLTWFVGTAGGALYYTLDGGATWTAISFSGSGSGSVRDIKFVTPSVGYMAHSTSTAGRIFRTIDGGNTWYLLPEATGNIPTNTYIKSLAVCGDPNIVYGGGLGTTPDGILVKASGS